MEEAVPGSDKDLIHQLKQAAHRSSLQWLVSWRVSWRPFEVSRAEVIQGGRSCYSCTELVGTYWHSTHKETGKSWGQGFTLGSPDMSFAVRGYSSQFLIHSSGATPDGNTDASFQRPVKGLLFSANRTRGITWQGHLNLPTARQSDFHFISDHFSFY